LSLFKKKTGAEPEIRTESGSGRNKVAQLVLLVLIAVFGYIYFFTSLIVPHEGAKPEQSATPAATPQVKQSMPPRPADTAAPPAAAPAAPAPTAPVAPAAAPAAAPAGGQKPAVATPAPASPPQAAAPAKAPAAAPVKKEEVKPSKPAEQKQAASVPKKEEAKPAKGPEKSAAAKDKQPVPAAPQAKKDQKPAPAVEKAREPKGAAATGTAKAKAAAGSYTILVGEFAAAEAAAVEEKLNKHKIKPVRNMSQKSTQMTRLYYGVYSDYDSYTAALEKLKQSVKGSFGVEKDGRYSVYAGSFGSPARAEAEKKRLADKGVKVEMQQVSLPQSTVRLSAGPFSGKEAAEKAASQLKKEGLSVKVVPKGK